MISGKARLARLQGRGSWLRQGSAEGREQETERDGTVACEPVRLQQVRSVITQPSAGQELTAGDLVIRGVAWSGAAPIDKVEVSVGGCEPGLPILPSARNPSGRTGTASATAPTPCKTFP